MAASSNPARNAPHRSGDPKAAPSLPYQEKKRILREALRDCNRKYGSMLKRLSR